MRPLWRVLGWLWETFAIITVGVVAYQTGTHAGFGRGARAVADLVIEMRHGAYETPEPWDSGRI